MYVYFPQPWGVRACLKAFALFVCLVTKLFNTPAGSCHFVKAFGTLTLTKCCCSFFILLQLRLLVRPLPLQDVLLVLLLLWQHSNNSLGRNILTFILLTVTMPRCNPHYQYLRESDTHSPPCCLRLLLLLWLVALLLYLVMWLLIASLSNCCYAQFSTVYPICHIFMPNWQISLCPSGADVETV